MKIGYKKLHFTFFWVMCFCFKASASPVIINGRIEGDVTSVKEVSLSFYDTYIYHSVNVRMLKCPVDRNGYFHFKLFPKGKTAKIGQLVLKYNQMLSDEANDYDVLSDILVEPRDSVLMIIRIKSDSIEAIKVSGTNAAKFQCRLDIALEYARFYNERRSAQPAIRVWLNEPGLFARYVMFRGYQDKMLAILKNAQGNIRPGVVAVMKADAIASIQYLWELEIADYYFKGDSVQKNAIKTFCQYHPDTCIQFGKEVSELSPLYFQLAYQKAVNLLSFQMRLDYNGIAYHDLFYFIVSNYTGRVREQLLAMLILDYSKNRKLLEMGNERSRYVTDALALISNASLKKAVRDSNVVKAMQGAAAYNFHLSNRFGEQISLSALKGNILLMDVWFTGCTGCAIFASKVRNNIIPRFNNNPKFKVVSICTDRSKDMWLKSLATGKYADPGSVNLHAPQGNSDLDFYNIPLVKYYGLQGLPFIILIDQHGKIIRQLTNADSLETILESISASLSAL